MWWGYVFCVMRKCQSVDSIDSITSNFTATYFGQYCTRTCWLWPVLELSSSPPDVPVTRGWLGRACQETRSPTLALALLSLLAPTSVRDRQLRRPQGKRRDYFLRKSIFQRLGSGCLLSINCLVLNTDTKLAKTSISSLFWYPSFLWSVPPCLLYI